MGKLSVIALIASVVVLDSCGFVGSDKDRNCRDLVPIDKMVDVLYDIYLMEGFFLANYELQVNDTLDYYFAGIFRKHNVGYQKFREAMDCYLFNRADMDSIHDRILRIISLRHDRVSGVGLPSLGSQSRVQFGLQPDCFLAEVCY